VIDFLPQVKGLFYHETPKYNYAAYQLSSRNCHGTTTKWQEKKGWQVD